MSFNYKKKTEKFQKCATADNRHVDDKIESPYFSQTYACVIFSFLFAQRELVFRA